MTPEFLFLVGTLALWVGIFCLVRAAAAGISLLSGAPGLDVNRLRNVATWSAGVGAALLVLANTLPVDAGREVPAKALAVPLVWVLMSFQGWVAVASVGMLVARLIQAKTALNQEERTTKLKGAAAWLGIAALFGWWFHSSEGEFRIFRGVVPTSWSVVIGLAILALVAMIVMAALSRATRSKGIAKTVGTHLALLSGCVIFGFPFAWLLITSFKEEKDLSSATGIIWVPKVQRTHTFFDEERPLVLAEFEGKSVRAAIDSELGDGRVLLEVERPYGLRGRRFEAARTQTKVIPRDAPIVDTKFPRDIADRLTQTEPYYDHQQAGGDLAVQGFVVKELDSGERLVEVLSPQNLKGKRFQASAAAVEPVRDPGLRWQNYSEALEWMPFETNYGLRYLQNTLWLVVMSVIGTILSCSLVAYGFSRLRFPGRDLLFNIMLATMMLPGAVTMLPTFLIFRSLGWIDTLAPLWVPTFFAGAFNVFLLRQFFSSIPMELEEAARLDGCNFFRTFWQVMLPQIKPALAAISIWTFMGAWNNFMGPLIYISTPERMPIAYALQLFGGDRAGQQGLLMAFAAMTIIPVLLLFFAAQKYFIEGVQLSGLGGR